ncbi:hypothetical protein N1027_03955 [Herbiconiux sp. CPCC 205763]|uniref:Septum formation-related domain-containing protein n=1 Tax=Herbiconiux aconitum TaxID=2970913 RepID=A0ABT2GR76_9MICO|nr:hypothetical protein [Herbiconiux aconitum]MCS5717286.1 hypothetical protein [Herbiconiux aconitum]
MSLPPNDPQRRDDAVPPAGAAGAATGGHGAHAAPSAGGEPAGGARRPDGAPADGGTHAAHVAPGGARQADGAPVDGGTHAAHVAPGGARQADAPVDGGTHAAHVADGVPVDHGASATAPAHVGAHRAPPPTPVGGGLSRTTWLLIAGGVVVLAVIVGLFFVGLRVGSSGDAAPAAGETPATSATDGGAASATPTSTETPTPTAPAPAADAAPAGPLAPGVHDWNALHGGECLSGYTSPWELQFTVADCGGEHNAQLVSKGAFAEDAAAPFPGEAELVSRLNLLCTAPTVLDYAVAQTVPDIQWQGAYPANDAQWATGDRAYFCFFSRTSGEPLGASLVAPPAG